MKGGDFSLTLHIDRLQGGDIPAALRLSTQAGWNQMETDWRRLLDLWPPFCLAGKVNGELVATATLVRYGEAIAWVGMVLVDAAHRRRGYGTAMTWAALREAAARGAVAATLTATAMGYPIYIKMGFIPVCTFRTYRSPDPSAG